MLNNPINLTDPSGEIPIETVWDAIVFGVDIFLYIRDATDPSLDPCTRNVLLFIDLTALGADGLALLTPYLPGGSGLVGVLSEHGLVIFAQGAARASSGMRIIQLGVKGVQAGTVLARTSGWGGGSGSGFVKGSSGGACIPVWGRSDG